MVHLVVAKKGEIEKALGLIDALPATAFKHLMVARVLLRLSYPVVRMLSFALIFADCDSTPVLSCVQVKAKQITFHRKKNIQYVCFCLNVVLGEAKIRCTR